MSQSAVQTAIRGHLASGWDTDRAAIREPNTDFNPQGKPWIELRFPGALNGRADLGAPDAAMWEEAGAFMVDIYVPARIGDAIAAELADAAAALFQGQDIGFVTCLDRLAGQSGKRAPDGVEGVWWGTSFGIAYRYQSIAG